MDNAGEVILTNEDSTMSKQHLIKNLDRLENIVENIRREALQMEEEMDNMYTTIDALRNSDSLNLLPAIEKDDINQIADRIVNRCNTVKITVHTTRSESQQNCLEEVNSLIDQTVNMLKIDPDNAKSFCQSYLASCTSSENEIGNKMFENAILGCTLDDQKRIHKRLQGLMDYIVHTTCVVESRDDL
ncbi:BAG family molecular chaperone regulator 2 [Daktulosphaira vitifoliae]|uniref:BAG family molecular chaperone regulator 2 n=1 Tax=Daktulosphaira vitifoliae TaxID=58002 RepID=UPI0021AA07EA|nr:BAG family molecular chaperone regulator 2 [Daktulosphaira vitifoliae]